MAPEVLVVDRERVDAELKIVPVDEVACLETAAEQLLDVATRSDLTREQDWPSAVSSVLIIVGLKNTYQYNQQPDHLQRVERWD